MSSYEEAGSQEVSFMCVCVVGGGGGGGGVGGVVILC